jgi:hypothetical protein
VRLTFTKRSGKHDDLVIDRDGRVLESIPCPKQGIIPHDMVHFAVESTLARRGFLALVADGESAGFRTKGGVSEEAIERLVEVFQAEMWGGRVAAAEFIETYEHACEARGHSAVSVTSEDVDAVRMRLDQLTSDWRDVPVNGSMTLEI